MGALDLSTTRAKRQLHILNPRRLNDEQEKYILKAFRPLLDRPVETVPGELARDDRRAFDRTVLEAFGLLDLYEPIRTALRELYALRMAVND